jgi:MYXO-CTERM domain-containing protein
MRRTVSLLLVMVSLLVPAAALAFVNLNSAGGYLWDIAEPGDWSSVGSLSDGTSDAYDTCYQLEVGGSSYNPMTGGVVRTLDGRQLEMPAATLAGLSVRRIIYVPSEGGDYARYLEVLENTSATAVTTTVSVFGNLGSDSSTSLVTTSSGDSSLTTADDWFTTDDSDMSGDPSLAHVYQGSSSAIRVASVTQSSDNIRYTWNVTVPAGGRAAILHFAVQAGSRATAASEARRLAEPTDEILVGLDDYLDDIQNFRIATPGAPRVRFVASGTVDEGAEIVIEAMVEDLEGETFTYSWDLDGDGTFGEAAGMSRYTVAAGTTDGPGSIRVGIRATDSAGNVSERYRTVQIQNLPPRITSMPPLTTSVGVNLRYQIRATDPAGDADPFTYTLLRGPERMSITSAGLVQWMPGASDVTPPGRTVSIEVQVDDGDMGTTTQVWEMTVSPNRQPTTPMAVYPTDMIGIIDPTPRLAVINSQDLDLDTLTYQFEIDTVSTFDSPNLRESGPIEEGEAYTAWQITEPLRENQIYHWRAWSNDGTVDSEMAQAVFYVVRDPSLPPPDAGRPDGGTSMGTDGGLIPGRDAGLGSGGGGCHVSASGSSSHGLLLVLVGLALVLRRRRHR